MAIRSTGTLATNTRKSTIRLAVGGKSEITGLTIFTRDLLESIKKVVSVSTDMRPIWKIAKAEIMAGIDVIFESEGKEGLPPGESWPPLNRRYTARKKMELGGERGILIYSGVMHSSIQVERETSNLLKITARDPKAAIHHYGRSIPGGKGQMPRRPFMVITDEAQQKITDALNAIYDAAMRNEKAAGRGYSKTPARMRQRR